MFSLALTSSGLSLDSSRSSGRWRPIRAWRSETSICSPSTSGGGFSTTSMPRRPTSGPPPRSRSSSRRRCAARLAGRVNRLARFLRSRGVGRDVPVAVCLERSVEMVVALLGIVTAGGAYLPLDPEYPAARITAMLASAAPPVVLVQERFRDRVAGAIGSSAGEVFQVDAQRQELAAFDDGPLDDIASPEDLAYVIYTSGSTGAPKGVMNTHAGIVNRLRWIQQKHALEADDRVLQKTPYGFDVSVWEFFWPLLVGARLVMLPPGFHREPSAIAKVVEATGITVIHFVPSMLEVFLDVPGLERSCRTLRHVFCSGEALPEGARINAC